MASCAVGCRGGPAEGEIGGRCHAPQGCHEHAWCDEGECIAGTCARYVPSEFAQLCPAGVDVPDECRAREGIDGGTLACCPLCVDLSRSEMDDGSIGPPGCHFVCVTSHTPSEQDASLECAFQGHVDDHDDYCCSLNERCFTLASSCGDGGHVVVCTGSAAPDAGGPGDCAVVDAGDSHRYCCVDRSS